MLKKNRLIILFIFLFCIRCAHQHKTGQEEEKYRPRVHFSPGKVWTSDAMGLLFDEGNYHLFYQYLPENSTSGVLKWGHVSTPDLISWNPVETIHLQDSIQEVFLSSVVVDLKNTSGLGKKGTSPWIALASFSDNALETSTGYLNFNHLGLIYSLDKGKTWSKHKLNSNGSKSNWPDCKFPKLIWNDDNQQWILVGSNTDHVNFYSSSNLTDWKYESDFELTTDLTPKLGIC